MAGERSDSKLPPARFEVSDVPPLLPLWLAAGLGGCVVMVFVTITLSYSLADHQRSRGPTQPLPPSPTLQVAPATDLQRYQVSKQQELQRGAMPIEKAMRVTAQQGWGPPK